MGFGQKTFPVNIDLVASTESAAKKKAELLSRIGSKANTSSLEILARLSAKPNINELLASYESLLDTL